MQQENSDSSGQNNSFDELKQRAKADSLKRQKDISVMIRDHGIREELEKKLSWPGVFFAGLSALKEIDILYLIGACSSADRLRYIAYEKKYILKKAENFQEFHVYDKWTGQEIVLPNAHITGSFKFEYPSFAEVVNFAENFGVAFDISKENISLAQEIKRTSGMFEMLKTNVHQFVFPVEDGMFFSNWYDKTSYEESEYRILQNLICLNNTLNLDDEQSKAFLNLMVYLRLKAHADDLYSVSEKKVTDLVDSWRMKYTAEFFNHLIPTQVNFSADERFLILYFAIQKTKDALKNYPDSELADYLSKWVNAGVKNFEENIPESFKGLNVDLPFDILNDSFYLSKSETVVKPDVLKNILKNKDLSLCEKVFFDIDKQMLEYESSQQWNWKKELDLLSPHFQRIYKLSHLPDVYTFYALGIIDKKELDLLTAKIKEKFAIKALSELEDYFQQYMEKEDDIPQIIQDGYHLFSQAKKDNLFTTSMLVMLLQQAGWTAEQINDISPSTKELLPLLLQEDFDTYIPLALKFNKEMFDSVDNFRELSAYLTEKALGVDNFSLDLNLPLEKCSQEGNLKATKINRLMLIGDIFDEMHVYFPSLKLLDESQKKLQKLIEYYYESTLQKLSSCINEEKQKEQADRMNHLLGIFSVFDVSEKTVSSEKEDMAFLVKMTKFYLKNFSNSKATQDYYVDWFDYVMDFSDSEKKELKSVAVQTPQYRKNPNLNDSMDGEDKNKFLKDMADHYFTENDQRANHYDKRVSFGVCTDIDFLYAMGIFTPFEYDKIGNKNRELCQMNNNNEVNIFDTWKALQNEKPTLNFPMIREAFSVMQQIKTAGELLDASYNYEGVAFLKVDYKKKEPTITEFDLQKNPLMAEGKMLNTLLMIMKDLKEYNLEESCVLRNILNSYWKESSQQLNELALSVEKKYPEISKRILDQRSLFGIKKVEKAETISNRFRYYPKLFLLINQALEKKYKHLGCLTKVKDFFEKEITPFVSFYQSRVPILKTFSKEIRERE